MARVFFLYSEAMPYTVALVNALCCEYGDSVTIISWDRRNLTDYQPAYDSRVVNIRRSSFETNQSLVSYALYCEPDIVYVSGRMDKAYLAAARAFKRRGIPVVAGCDNQWNGSLRQSIQGLCSPWLFHRFFDYIWVPGIRQYEYARRMGYAHSEIIFGVYAGDTRLFDRVFEENRSRDIEAIRPCLLFVGRCVAAKGLDLLVSAFLDSGLSESKWKFLIAGAGALAATIPKDPSIEALGFLGQSEIAAILQRYRTVFCLPSRREPWGVVVHEMSAAGCPIIVSTAVGAGDDLVIPGFNGFRVPVGSQAGILRALKMTALLSPDEWAVWSARSAQLSKRLSPQISASVLRSIVAAS